MQICHYVIDPFQFGCREYITVQVVLDTNFLIQDGICLWDRQPMNNIIWKLPRAITSFLFLIVSQI